MTGKYRGRPGRKAAKSGPGGGVREGWTLAEIMVVCILLIPVFFLVWQFTTSAIMTQERVTARSVARGELERALEDLVRVSRRASGITPMPVSLVRAGPDVTIQTELTGGPGSATLSLGLNGDLMLDRSQDAGPARRRIARQVQSVSIEGNPGSSEILVIYVSGRAQYASPNGPVVEGLFVRSRVWRRNSCSLQTYLAEP